MQVIDTVHSPLVPRLTLVVFLSRLGIVDVEDSDESDEELVPRISDDESDPFDLVRGWGAALGVSIIVSILSYTIFFIKFL